LVNVFLPFLPKRFDAVGANYALEFRLELFQAIVREAPKLAMHVIEVRPGPALFNGRACYMHEKQKMN
jgi:hypothetical protein